MFEANRTPVCCETVTSLAGNERLGLSLVTDKVVVGGDGGGCKRGLGGSMKSNSVFSGTLCVFVGVTGFLSVLAQDMLSVSTLL